MTDTHILEGYLLENMPWLTPISALVDLILSLTAILIVKQLMLVICVDFRNIGLFPVNISMFASVIVII